MFYNFIKKYVKSFCFLFFKWIGFLLLLAACSPGSSSSTPSSPSAPASSAPAASSSSSKSAEPVDLYLISVIISGNGNVSYVNLSPLHYEAKKKGLKPIKITPQDSQKDRPMELIIYATCDRAGDAQGMSVLGFRAKFLRVNFLLSPHPKDLPAAYYLSPKGLFRMGKELSEKRPYFQEEGNIKILGAQGKVWGVNIRRSDTTAVNPKTDYRIELSEEADQPLFIKALMSAAKSSAEGIPQVTVLLESPSLHVKATYSLISGGGRQYKLIRRMNIIEWWNKQLKWCPNK